jgi:hypothetical protein
MYAVLRAASGHFSCVIDAVHRDLPEETYNLAGKI